ncbi:unnamed protein product [Ectocarpus sp. CCAP 1310/34]|nr:unnamed protein product [Ectocarpus sp. CCAP 1310/34]
MHTPGVLRPEGVKLRVVKASGRTLEDTKFHMEIRTLRPGQVWSVCRRYKDFQSLHSCLQATFPALVLPRLPRPPTGGGGMALEPATLERARAGLQAYAAAVVGSVPAAWGLEELVMFLDSEEKGRRLFSSRKRRKKEATRRVVALPSPAAAADKEEEEEEEGEEEEEAEEEEEEEEEEYKPVARKGAAFPPDLVSPKTGTPGVGFGQKSLLDLKVEEKKLALAALEGAAANHFDGVGAVMNAAVSFSEDSDDGASQEFGEESDFIDGEDAIRAMLDRDADEAEDDNLFSIPAGTDFGIPLDDDDDDDDQDCSADAFDITYHG